MYIDDLSSLYRVDGCLDEFLNHTHEMVEFYGYCKPEFFFF